MSNQLLNNATALRMFFTDPVFVMESENTEPNIQAINPDQNAQEKTISEPPASINKAIEFIGDNKKNIFILVVDEENPISTAAGTELLKNIIKYLKLQKEDFALLNYSKYKHLLFEDFKSALQPKIVLSFGVSASLLNLKDENILQDPSLIFTVTLDEMSNNIDAKKDFFQKLKNIPSW